MTPTVEETRNSFGGVSRYSDVFVFGLRAWSHIEIRRPGPRQAEKQRLRLEGLFHDGQGNPVSALGSQQDSWELGWVIAQRTLLLPKKGTPSGKTKDTSNSGLEKAEGIEG